MKQSFISLLTICCLAISCNLMNQVPQLDTDIDNLLVDAKGGIYEIQVVSNADWSATAQPTTGVVHFFSLLNTRGSAGKSTIRISMRPNPLASGRAGVINLHCKNEAGAQSQSVTIIQKGADAYTKVSNWSEITVPSEGGSFSVNVESSTKDWRIVCDKPDVQLSVTEKASDSVDEPIFYTLTVTVPANPTSEKRIIKLTLTDRPAQTIWQECTFYQSQP